MYLKKNKKRIPNFGYTIAFPRFSIGVFIGFLVSLLTKDGERNFSNVRIYGEV